ncbi:hypothetical protein, conserved [Plasmodium ovale wallikeri]|nr:hypothetical protein, conserved [Plasmodium ovale wallikeri]
MRLCKKTRKIFKKFLKTIIALQENHEVLHTCESKIFLSKYTNYNSWSFFCKERDQLIYEIEDFKLGCYFEYDDLPKEKMSQMRINRNGITVSESGPHKGGHRHGGHSHGGHSHGGHSHGGHSYGRHRHGRYRHGRHRHGGHGQSWTHKKSTFCDKTKERKKGNKDKSDYEKALRPSHVQMLADMSSFLSYFHILNIMKTKFLSAQGVYSHVSFTLVFFLWKLLYMDVVLCLLKIFILFYTSDSFVIGLFLIIAMTNIADSYIINLVDNNLLHDMNVN